MEDPGQKLKRAREGLNLRYRDVEIYSQRIREKHGNEEFAIALSRLSDIENKGTVPSIYKLYSLCAIYGLNILDVLDWYGVNVTRLAADAATLEVPNTHPIDFTTAGHGDIQVPLALDPGMDLRRTTYVSRMIQRWGKLPLMLLEGLDLKNRRYAFIGSEDWSMYPILLPGALVMVDETKKRILQSGWNNEYERPIYFVEHSGGYACGWCSVSDKTLILQPHPASCASPSVYPVEDVDVIGQVIGVAMQLDVEPRRTRS